jgi:hypothetical protein
MDAMAWCHLGEGGASTRWQTLQTSFQDLTSWYMVLLKQSTVFQLKKKSPAFMEPEASTSCYQEPTIGPYLETVEIITPYFSKITFDIIIPSTSKFTE